MQILLYVLTLLMLLSILTYARIDGYRSFSAVRVQLESLMATNGREYPNLRAISWYNNTVATSKEEKELQSQRQIQASSKLSLEPLLNQEVRKSQYEQLAQVRIAFAKLMKSLYGKKRFYRQLEEKRPDFVEEIIDRIVTASDKLSKEEKITSSADFANLDLGDSELNEAFYKMLKGTKRADSKKEALANAPKSVAAGDREEIPTDDGYLSLLDFINTSSKSKLRVFLAAKQLLLAISGDPLLVDELLTVRKDFYKRVTADPPQLTVDQATQEFQALFRDRISSVINETLLDYSVTKTDPKPYE